jgi:hypothetical protein
MSLKKYMVEFCAVVSVALLLVGCSGEDDSVAIDATIASYQTQVAQLDAENEELLAGNRDLRTAVDEVTSYFGIGEYAEASPTAIDLSEATPNAAIGDGEILTFGDWEVEFVNYSISKEVQATGDEYNSYWEADDMYHTVLLRVENVSQHSQEFPFSDFRIREQFGAIYSGSNLIGDYPPTDHSRMRIPGTEYEILLAFDIPNEATGLSLLTQNGSLFVSLDQVTEADVAATATPSTMIGDGTVVEYANWRIEFVSVNTIPPEEGEQDVLYEVLIRAENMGGSSQVFPFSDFEMIEPYGATYGAASIALSIAYDYDEDDLLIPGSLYERHLVFVVPEQAINLLIRSEDGTLLIDPGI